MFAWVPLALMGAARCLSARVIDRSCSQLSNGRLLKASRWPAAVTITVRGNLLSLPAVPVAAVALTQSQLWDSTDSGAAQQSRLSATSALHRSLLYQVESVDAVYKQGATACVCGGARAKEGWERMRFVGTRQRERV